MDWVGCSRVKVKMRVSWEIWVLLFRRAFVQDFGWRKMGRGDEERVSSGGLDRRAREAAVRVPIW